MLTLKLLSKYLIPGLVTTETEYSPVSSSDGIGKSITLVPARVKFSILVFPFSFSRKTPCAESSKSKDI